MKHSLEKNVCISSSRMTASDSVSLPRLDTDGCMSDTPETMGGLSGANKGHTQKSYKLSSGVRTCPVGVLQTWKDTDHRRCSHRLVRNATFFEQNVP